MIKTNFEITKKQKAFIEKEAARKKISQAEMIRMIIDKYIIRYDYKLEGEK